MGGAAEAAVEIMKFWRLPCWTTLLLLSSVFVASCTPRHVRVEGLPDGFTRGRILSVEVHDDAALLQVSVEGAPPYAVRVSPWTESPVLPAGPLSLRADTRYSPTGPERDYWILSGEIPVGLAASHVERLVPGLPGFRLGAGAPVGGRDDAGRPWCRVRITPPHGAPFELGPGETAELEVTGDTRWLFLLIGATTLPPPGTSPAVGGEGAPFLCDLLMLKKGS
jgi:hypothetical protein